MSQTCALIERKAFRRGIPSGSRPHIPGDVTPRPASESRSLRAYVNLPNAVEVLLETAALEHIEFKAAHGVYFTISNYQASASICELTGVTEMFRVPCPPYFCCATAVTAAISAAAEILGFSGTIV